MYTPSRLPAPPAHFTQRQSSCKAGADHLARWAGAFGGEGSVPGFLKRRGEDVDLWWWWGWRCLGERERHWRGLEVKDGYGRRGEREGEVDMGRWWRAWWRLGEREWWWRGLGVVDGYGRRGERGTRRGLWGEGEVGVGRRWRAWRGLGVGVVYGRSGEGEVDMGRRWRSWWRPGERERRERGPGRVVAAPWGAGAARVGGSGALAVWGVWALGANVPCGGGAGAPPFAGPGLIARAGQISRRRRVLGGGGAKVPCRPWIRHVGVWWRQRLVVWVA